MTKLQDLDDKIESIYNNKNSPIRQMLTIQLGREPEEYDVAKLVLDLETKKYNQASWDFAIKLLDKEIDKETDSSRRTWLAEVRHNWVAEKRIDEHARTYSRY